MKVVRLCVGKVLAAECISTTDLLFLEIAPVLLRQNLKSFESVWITHLESFENEQEDVKYTKYRICCQKEFKNLSFP